MSATARTHRSILAILATGLLAVLPAAVASAQESVILAGLHADAPTIASLAMGTGKSVAEGRLFFVMFEPGIAGARTSVGLANLKSRPIAMFRATLLHTWGSPAYATRNQNYLGPEFQTLGRHGLGVRAGILLPLGHALRPAPSAGLSFGF
jgi:hypothetical protein